MSILNTTPWQFNRKPLPSMHDTGVIPWLYYNKDSNSIFCNQCHSAVWFNALSRHLADIHHLTPLQRRPVVNYFKPMDIAQVQTDLNPWPDNSPVLSYLPTYPGYACLHCSTSLTTTKSVLSYIPTYSGYACLYCSTSLTTTKSMSLHIGKTHDIHSHYKVHYKPVMLQTWYNQP